MAITFVGGAVPGGNPTTSFTVSPGAVAAGEFLTVDFCHNGTGNGTVTDDSGDGVSWTRQGGGTFGGTKSVHVYWKRVGTNAAWQGGTVSITAGSLTNSSSGAVCRYAGVDTTGAPFRAAPTLEDNASGNTSHASITTSAGDWVVLVVANSPDLSVTPTSPLVLQHEKLSTGGTDCSTMVAGFEDTGGGGSGTLAWTQTASASGSLAYALIPAGFATVTGTATGVFGFTGTAAGQPGVPGTATGLFGFTGTAIGVIEGPTLGTATGLFGFTGSATGTAIFWYVNRSIVAGSDDGEESPGSSPGITNAGHILQTVGQHLGLRFTDLPFQQGANIRNASVSLVLMDTSKNDAEGTWYAHDVDDGQTFTTTDGDIDGLPKTTASVAWTTNDLGSAGATVTTPSLTPIIQEVVDRPGWRPGNCICLIYVHNSTTDKIQVATYENVTEAAPSFYGEYWLIPIVTGDATTDIVFNGTALGVVSGATTGVATGLFGFTGTALGTPETFGVATGTFGFTGTALGIDIQPGTATGSFGFTGTAAARPRKVGVATGLFGFTGTAVGVRRGRGTATGLFGFVGAAIGSSAGVKVGNATGLFGFTGIALGIDRQAGTATGVFGFTAPALGKPVVPSTATGLFGFAGIALGKPRVPATGTGLFGFVGTAIVIPPIPDIGWPVIVVEEPKAVTVTDPIQSVLVVDHDPNIIVNDPDQTVMVSDPVKTVLVTDPGQTVTV